MNPTGAAARPVQHAASRPPVAPARGRSSAAVLALVRADCSNYLRRLSTWLSFVVLLVLASMNALSGLFSSYEDDKYSANHISLVMSAAVLVVCAGTGYLAGAAWMGFEHTSGSLGTWLTVTPRRTRVWLSRLLVAVSVPTAVGFLGLLVARIPVLSDPDAPVKDAWSTAFGPQLAIIATISALGFSIASLGRHVLWALGAAAAFFMLGIITDEFAGHDKTPAYGLHTALGDFMDGPVTYSSQLTPAPQVLGMAPHIAGGIIWVSFTLLVVVLALAVFRRANLD